MTTARQQIEQLERAPAMPAGGAERFSGYGVMGLPFVSGHVLALRRFPASSIGRAYTSLWHRAPRGEWTFFHDAPREQSCPRYFGPAIERTVERPIEIRWTGPSDFVVKIDEGRVVDWEISLADGLQTRALSAMARLLPGPLWRSRAMVWAIGSAAGRLLGAGHLALAGRVPSGQRFAMNPRAVWVIATSRASVDGTDLGPIGPLPLQARLADFRIPQRGLFLIASAHFDPFDPQRHSMALRTGLTVGPSAPPPLHPA
jgi:hypothetical protein